MDVEEHFTMRFLFWGFCYMLTSRFEGMWMSNGMGINYAFDELLEC